MSFVPVSSNSGVITTSVVSPTYSIGSRISKRSWAEEESEDEDEEDELIEQETKEEIKQEDKKPEKNFKFCLGVQSHDAKKMALIHDKEHEKLKFVSNGEKNNFQNYFISVKATNKNEAIQIVVDFLTANQFHHKTIEIFRNNAILSGPKKPFVAKSNSSASNAQIPKVVKPSVLARVIEEKKFNSSASNAQIPKVVKPSVLAQVIEEEKFNFKLFFSCFKNTSDAEAIKNNVQVLKFIDGATNDKFDNYTVIVSATDKNEAIQQIVSKLKRIGISAKTIEIFINKSK